jgi:hypothetical protein
VSSHTLTVLAGAVTYQRGERAENISDLLLVVFRGDSTNDCRPGVDAIGKPSIRDHLSASITYTP